MTKTQFAKAEQNYYDQQILHMPRKTDDELNQLSDSNWYERSMSEGPTERLAFLKGQNRAIIAEMEYRRTA
jgi:hypothetical protein